MNLNENERQVLEVLAEESDDYGYMCFAAIGERLQIDRKPIRRACRSLARKGLAEFGKGLWRDDGSFYGSGYSATRAGKELWSMTHASTDRRTAAGG